VAGEQRTSAALKRVVDSPPALLGVVAAAMLALIAIPVYKKHQMKNPASEARAAYVSLKSQIESPTNPPITLPQGSSAVVEEEQDSALRRDLFSPMTRSQIRRAENKPPPPPKPRRPELSGIFIDGAVRRAVIDGSVVTAGAVIKGYSVVEIHRDWVLLRRGDSVERLRLGGK